MKLQGKKRKKDNNIDKESRENGVSCESTCDYLFLHNYHPMTFFRVLFRAWNLESRLDVRYGFRPKGSVG